MFSKSIQYSQGNTCVGVPPCCRTLWHRRFPVNIAKVLIIFNIFRNLFCIASTSVVKKSLFLYHNIEHNIKHLYWYGGNLSYTSMILLQKQQEWKCTDKQYKQPINKIYSFNNTGSTFLVNMWSYLCKQWPKQAKLVYLQFFSNYGLFSKNCCRKLLKKALRL